MNLMYLTFGENLKNHYQANFSILSFLAQKDKIDSITIFTDYPEFYKNLDKHVTIISIDDNILKDWEGEYQFFWRVKIKAILHLIEKLGDKPIMYLDSDTFLYGNLDLIFEILKQDNAVMHEKEGNLNELKTKTEKLMWKQLKAKKFGGVTINEKSAMWNAGTIVIPANKNKEALNLALSICDDMCKANVTRRLIEQFSISVALDTTYGLKNAKKTIGHYWGNKEDWNKVITNFFVKSNLLNYNLQETINEINRIDLTKIATRKRFSSNKSKLIKIINKLFSAKKELFANTQ